MAQAQIGSSVPAKLSFAKIAAMPAPNVAPALPNIIRDTKPHPSGSPLQHNRTSSRATSNQGSQDQVEAESKAHVTDITAVVEHFSVSKDNVDATYPSPYGDSGDSLRDDRSQLSSSSLKQQSFDTKSMASVTTFAMDEKESIRPDDSASVRAVEDDDIHPGLSRNSSFQHEHEAHSNVPKNNVRTLGPGVTIAARRYPYTTLTNPPRFGDLPIEPVLENLMPPTHSSIEVQEALPDGTRSRPSVSDAAPDEKLLEALSSLKDRLPLLQLEEKIMAFISTGRDTVLELPPQNSFARLLTHKLADYYHLAHHINEDNNSVRIFRTEFCGSPISLAEIAKSVPVGAQQISHATQVKIMRRVQLGPRQFSAGNSTAASSSVPSKATSENGVETNSEEGLISPAEGTPSRDRSKLTREEREAQYKAARERIFGDFQESVTSESGSTGEASASMSRSSSSSGKRKSRKHKTPKDDTFEARSSFIPSYAPIHMQPTYEQVYGDMQYQGGYNSGTYSPNAYNATSSPNYPVYDQGMPYNNQGGYNVSSGVMYGPGNSWPSQAQQQSSSFYTYPSHQTPQPQLVNPQGGTQYQSGSNTAAAPPQNWSPNQYPNPYAPSPTNSGGSSWQSFNTGGPVTLLPYQYGQLPPQSRNGGVPYANQHPVPGSFVGSKSLFNPQTRSFVPSNTSGRGGGRGGRKRGQGPGSTRTSGASSPAVPSTSDSTSAKSKEDSLQRKYGTHANLPKKPPPSQVSPHFTNDHSGSTTTPLVVNGSGKGSAS